MKLRQSTLTNGKVVSTSETEKSLKTKNRKELNGQPRLILQIYQSSLK
ncbi:hypothetical protein ACIGEL_08860 [Rossellomorea aquimaris]